MTADEAHHKSKMKQVVQDEVRTAGTGSIDLLNIAREEVEDVAKLQDEQDDANSPQSAA